MKSLIESFGGNSAAKRTVICTRNVGSKSFDQFLAPRLGERFLYADCQANVDKIIDLVKANAGNDAEPE